MFVKNGPNFTGLNMFSECILLRLFLNGGPAPPREGIPFRAPYITRHGGLS